MTVEDPSDRDDDPRDEDDDLRGEDDDLRGEDDDLRILVVDDQRPARRLLVHILSELGHRVVEAPGGEEAVARCRAERIDLVLLDVRMPGMSGTETFLAIREHVGSLPVFFTTGLGEHDLVGRALGEGSFALVHEPLDARQLASRIRSTGPPAAVLVVEAGRARADELASHLCDAGRTARCVGSLPDLLAELGTSSPPDLLLPVDEEADEPAITTAIHGTRPGTPSLWLRTVRGPDEVRRVATTGSVASLRVPLDLDLVEQVVGTVLEATRPSGDAPPG